MLSNIITHTPLYVWAILGFLVFRGVAAMRDRELSLKTLAIMPLVMLGLTLQDMAVKFGLGGAPLAAWLLGAAATAALVWRGGDARGNAGGNARIGAGSADGLLRVRGSRLPLVLMLAIFLTKYATAVTLAMAPGLARQTLFAAAACALFGVFNGLFLGRLAVQAAFAKGQAGAGLDVQASSLSA